MRRKNITHLMSPNDKKLLHDLPLYQYSAKVRQEWGYISTPPICLHTWTGITTSFNFHVFTVGVAEITIFCVSVPCCIIRSFRRVQGTNPQYHFMISLHCLLWTERNAVSELNRNVPRELRGIRSWREVHGKHMGNWIQETSRLQTSFVPLILPMRL